ncbi:hypothetical protein MUN89_03525 [Halobacillus salinarum]|uniref:Uncharacterized protein n=1 Tax=Halobacillus salinarum TaxID=2932257 RepID=A0ABY4EKP1_9BACI|nr:hypothetical protein [Halobacillus salinarum]UOQ45036.1 hypothetical protein MUN89_03525 [Halobacillus salinarum]
MVTSLLLLSLTVFLMFLFLYAGDKLLTLSRAGRQNVPQSIQPVQLEMDHSPE